MQRPFALGLLALLALAPTTHALAEWTPEGAITFHIGFKAGGGADTQARLIGSEIASKLGWKFVYKNIAGKGGANMARSLKGGRTDGHAIGMAEVATFAYTPLRSADAGFRSDDFDYVISTAPSQMGLVVRKASGWQSLADVAAAAKARKLRFAVPSPRLGDAAALIAKKFDMRFNSVRAKGGRGVLDGLMAGKVDIGFVAGLQVKGVKAGELVNVASAEAMRLAMSPDAPTLKELGIAHAFGTTFVVVAPKGIEATARETIAAAIKGVLGDERSKAHTFITRTFGAPPLETGAALAKTVADAIARSRKLLAAIK